MKMRSPALVALFAGTIAAPTAEALDFGNGFQLTGDVELEYVKPESGDAFSGAFTDLTLSWRSQGGGALTFGADVSYVAIYDLDDGDDLSTFWYALVVGTSYGEFSIGRPRPLHDTLFDTPDLAATRAIGLELIGVSGSFAGTIGLVEGSNIDMWGATFLGQSGSLTYGLGLHNISEGSISTNIYEAVVMYELGATELHAGLEIGGEELGDFTKVLVGAGYAADSWSVGGEVSNLNVAGDNISSAKLYGDYLVTDGLTLGVQVQKTSANGSDINLYGVSGTYSFGSGFAELGLGASDSSGSSSFASASIGLRF